MERLMSPGIAEETGSTARTLITSLSSAPMVLAVLVFNILYMAGTFYVMHTGASRWEGLVEIAFKACAPAQKTE
jgi:hypothetical protein